MIKFRRENNKLILSYSSEQPDASWVFNEMKEKGRVSIVRAFTFTSVDLISSLDNGSDVVEFHVANKEGKYYRFSKKVLSLKNDLFIDEAVDFNKKFFVAERGISVIPKVDNLVENSIYIGGDHEDAIPLLIYIELLKSFPNSYELNMYSNARISSILSSYIDTKEDYESKYQKYLNKKVTQKGEDLSIHFSEFEVFKYNCLLDKLNKMLNDEVSYSEAQWQEELLQIILLLYPKYIHVFKEARVRDTYSKKNRFIDYLLVDSTGNIDIIEIKKPFDKCIVTQRTYRDNYVPLKELSGTVMQIEKYIFYLNKWGLRGEDKLTEDYKEKLAPNFKLKITNPSGIIIMGRKKGLSDEQLQDFEIIKRKYKNVIDIITYDDLIERLQFTIKQWEAINSGQNK
ncbi:Shedu anti-phage system protein SduA domain-containing protein [Aliivibrio fischeri]|uniref:Shedu anti-phage system protein SduA domain-containing protein n=1 Tax=Aliivibrio fischeri TaxID=668 RepID=UPI0013241F82|nr:DUF4263 domain-containing protein [Aliivibrio fischeri]MUK67713.1 DUF4263 domain-containing protein [Aliivibrio fischeri]MUL22385.1 DUF4263 domain-containing protein [Aliivibrio fischeri]MUL26176.1 DUF4263 domain-containing protein [Aliivibrio fischeri]